MTGDATSDMVVAATRRRRPPLPWRLARAMTFLAAGQLPPPLDGDPIIESILVLQANHIGDLLVTTPLLEALRGGFPHARITVAAGPWNADTVANNPNVDEFFPLSAPWDNAFVSPQTPLARLRFLLFSPEARELARRRFSIGVDAIGTRTNALMLLRIRARRVVAPIFDASGAPTGTGMRHQIEGQLDRARTMGLSATPAIRPQIFLTPEERQRGADLWNDSCVNPTNQPYRVVIAPASSSPYKCWSIDDFRAVTKALHDRGDVSLAIIGGNDTVDSATRIATAAPSIRNLAGRIRLRDTFGLIANADFVLCNANLAWHVAAAFDVPSAVVLASVYRSAEHERMEWGYPSSLVLGRDATHDGAYEAAEVTAIINKALDARRDRDRTVSG